MNIDSTAPACIVIDCDELSALTDVAEGKLWSYHAHYCAACYQRLLDGADLRIDPARLELHRPEVRMLVMK